MKILSELQQNRRSSFLFLMLGIIPLISSSSITAYFISHEADIQLFTWNQWIIFYCITSFTMAFAITPTTYIAIVSGYFLGWISIPFMLISYLVASIFGYLLAFMIDNGNFLKTLETHEKTQHFIKNIKKKELTMIILARLSPALPFAMMNVLLAVLKIPIKKFVWAGFLGMLPRTILSIFLGTQVKEISLLFTQHKDNMTNQLFMIGLFIATTIGIFYFIKKQFRYE